MRSTYEVVEKTMEQVLFDWAEGEGAKTIL